MNWKTTLILLVVVSALGAWVYWGESKVETTEQAKLAAKRVFDPQVKSEDVTKLVIDRGSGLKDEIVLEKEEKVGWKVTKPVADRADDGKVREILNKLEFLEWKERLDAAHAATAQFGDVEQRLTISRAADKGGDVTLEIGQKIPGEVRYARVQGKPEVYIVNKELADDLAWDLFELRSKELFTTIGIDAGKLTVKLPGEAGPGAPPKLVELLRDKDRFWRIGGEGGELADTKKVQDLVNKVQQMKPTGIVADAPSDADLAKDGLDKPAITIELVAADAPPADPNAKDAAKPTPKSETLSLGNEVEAGRDVRYARFSGRPFVYKVDAGDALRDLRKDPGLLRSEMLFPLHAAADGVTALEAKWKDDARAVRLAKKDEDWSIESPGSGKAEKDNVRALVKLIADTKVAGREPGDAAQHLEKYALTDPALTVSLEESGEKRTVQVGSEVPGQKGTFYVRRADEARVFTAKLGDLSEKLRQAPLALRSKSLLKASHWDAVQVSLTSPEGKTDFETKKDKGHWTIAGVEQNDLDEGKLAKMIEGFDDVKASELVAEVTSESLVKYGLDKPSKLAVTIEKFDTDSGSKKKEDQVLLLGKREGDKVYATAKDGTAIGEIDAEFLDRIARGFRKGKELFSVSTFDVTSVVVKEGDKEILNVEKRRDGLNDEWFLGKQQLVMTEVREKLLDAFDKVEATKVESATDASKKEHGLAPAWRTVTIHTKKAFGDKQEETKVLLLGKRSGEHDVYAMDQSGGELGVIYDAPVRKVDDFVAHPPVAPAATPAPGGSPAPGTAPGPGASPGAGAPAASPSPAPAASPSPAPAQQPPGAMPTPPPAPSPAPSPAASPAATPPPSSNGGTAAVGTQVPAGKPGGK